MQTLRYRDFVLTFTPDGKGGYVARASSPQGEGRAAFRVPFTDEKLELLVLKLGRTRSRTRAAHSPELAVARELGGALFDAVFTGAIRDCLRTSMNDVLRTEDGGLRVKLKLQDAPGLAELPWELLLDAATDTFLAQSVQTPIVRWIELAQPLRPLAVRPPLRILVMVSSPTDYARLDVEHETQQLMSAMQHLVDRGRVEITVVERATMSELQRLLRTERFHIFHFIGHGEFDPATQGGLLVLEHDDERGARVEAHRLATLLRDHRSLRLAVLNACEGARNSRVDPYAGVATTLVRQGIPAVIAMQFEITDHAAIGFAREFYGAIADGIPVDAAVSEARKAIYAQPNDTEWATPVLYMRTPDGAIFDVVDAPDAPTARPRRGADAERTSNVLFTAHRPRTVLTRHWYPLLVSAHVVDPPTDPDLPAPADAILQDVRAALRDAPVAYDAEPVEGAVPVAGDRQLLVLRRAARVEFDPPWSVLDWSETDRALARFRMRTDLAEGESAKVSIAILNGPILLAEISFELRVGGARALTDEPPEEVAGSAYRRIFVSYSPRDEEIVRRMEAYARALGDEYLRDVTQLRAGQRHEDRLYELIEQADVFQLFWSRNALESDEVEREVRHALGLGRPGFVRPFHWESPLPVDASRNRPPAALLETHFQLVDFGVEAKPTARTEPDQAMIAGGGTQAPPQVSPDPSVVAPPPDGAVHETQVDYGGAAQIEPDRTTLPRTQPRPTPSQSRPSRSGNRWLRLGAPLAACLAVIIAVAQIQFRGFDAAGTEIDPAVNDSTRPVGPPDPTPDSVVPVPEPVPPPPPPPIPQPGPPPVVGVRITPGQVALWVGGEVTIEARAMDASGTRVAGAPIRWRAADPSLVRIAESNAGQTVVRALAAGSTTLTARAGTVAETVAVNVRNVHVTGASAALRVDEVSRELVFGAAFTPQTDRPGPWCISIAVLVNDTGASSELSTVDVAAGGVPVELSHRAAIPAVLGDRPQGEGRVDFRVRVWPVDCDQPREEPLADVSSTPVCMVRFAMRDWQEEACDAPESAGAGMP